MLLSQVIIEDGTGYNEMILKGHPDTTVEGVFFIDSPKSELEGRVLADMVEAALKKEIPVIKLQPQKIAHDDITDPK